MKILRKISGLFLAFMLLFAVLFVIAPQEEVKADVVTNNITSIDDLKGTVWNLKEDVSYITFGVECWLTFTVSGSVSPFTYRTDNSLMTQNKIIIFGEQNDNLSFQENMLSTSKTIFSNGLYNTNYGTFPRRLIFNNWESYGFFYGNEEIFIQYLYKIAVQQITDVNELKGTSWKLRQDITNIQIDDSGYSIGYSDFATMFTEEKEQEINGLFTAIGNVDSEVTMAVIVGYEMGTEFIQEPLYYDEYLVNNVSLTFNNSDNELIVVDLVEESMGQASYLTWYETLTIFFKEIPTNIITIIDNVNNTSYEIEYQEGYTLEANNIYLNALEYEEYIPNNWFNSHIASSYEAEPVKYVRTFKNWSIISLSGAPRSYDITLPFTFTSRYSGEDWLLFPQYEENDYIPYRIGIHYLNNDGSEYIEFTTMYGAVPFADGATITNTLSPFSNYSLIIEGNNTLLYPTINYETNALFNSLLLDNNKLVFSSALTGTSVSQVFIRPYIKYNENEFEVGDTIILDKTGNYNTALNNIEYFEIEIFARSNGSASGDTGDINVNSAFKTFFNLVRDFLNMKLGFITLGEIIGLVLAIGLLGFIFKVWNGANNG